MPTRPLRQTVLGAARRVSTPRLKRAARRIGGTPLVRYERRGLTPVLTVVMPVHNVVEYLPAALDSVLTQSLHELEVIAVDDASTDGCLDVLRAYERRDPRVRVLTQPKSGQGPARNLGVRHARGEFLTFVDSDDTVPPRAFAHMIERLRQSGSDFCVGSVRRFRHDEYTPTVWARTVHAADRLGTTLEEFPNAMQDIIACNRMFRTAFWRDRVGDFRGHIAYEDHVPMLTAYARAERFDILHEVTYNWRIRENGTSTGQQKANIENLLDRIAVKEEAREMLDAEASDFVRDLWVGRTLEVDFPPFIAHALRAGDMYRNLLAATYRTFLDRATDRALDLVTVRQKIRAELVAEGRWDDVAEVTGYFEDIGMVPPTEVVDGVVQAVVPDSLPFLADLPPRVRRLSTLECHFEGVLQHAEWDPDTLRLDGWAYLRGVGITGRSADFRAWLVAEDGERVGVEVAPTVLPEANIWSKQAYAPYDGAGFTATVDLAALPARRARWQLEVEVGYDGLSGTGALRESVWEAAGTRPNGTRRGNGVIRGVWDDARGFCLDLEPEPVLIEALHATGTTVGGRLAVPAGRRVGRVLLDRHDAPAVAARMRSGDGYVEFSATLPADATLAWRLLVVVDGHRQAPVWSQGTTSSDAPGAHWVPGADAGAELVRGGPLLRVAGVTLGERTLTLAVERDDHPDDLPERIVLGNPRLRLARRSVTERDGRWLLEHELATSEFGEPEHLAPSGRYELWVEGADPASVTLVTPSFAGRMPQRSYGTAVDLRVAHAADGRLKLELEPPLPADALGAPNRRRLRDAYRTRQAQPTQSVLFGCYRGEFATDSQLQLDRALAVRRPELVRYWGVADRSTVVPEGSVPLLLNSAEWYDALASSRYLCSNVELPLTFRRRPYQRYLQTFHGYPFKSMGIGFWRSKGLTEEELQYEVGKVNRQWDTILVPSEECVAYYREQYDYDGDVLVAGYPRCDPLVTADAAAVRSRVLQRLGVPADRTVVLYAPTYRDRLTTRTFAARRFDALDLAGLARSLGEGFTILVRGHNNNQREFDRVTGTAHVVDVTDYPEVNDLTLAADVAVLDYSSLRFDWAITGKPMVFFVPDREEYFALRTPLFPFEGTAPGPWTTTTAEVATALRDLGGVRRTYADEIAAFNRRFNTLNDGHATERVYEAFFAPEHVR
ncbi:MAG: bifunctional glycosyltransferase/CDP-glycerol:glycerophosphate glycerophosphotransferase [Marmoricola sp.]